MVLIKLLVKSMFKRAENFHSLNPLKDPDDAIHEENSSYP
jgi:hypothetical protein